MALVMRWIRVVQGVLVGAIALSLPAAGLSVFEFGADRGTAGDFVTVVFFGALVGLLSTPWWPAAGQRGRARFEGLQGMVMIWFGVTFVTHLTWELGWLLLRESIRVSPDALWAYPWWAYIDGGDARYAGASALLVTMESLSVTNGAIGMSALWLRYRSGKRSRTSTLMLMATAVVHLYSTAVYFGSELLDGYPHVDTSSFIDFVVKFWLLNGVWLVMPWAVLLWGRQTLERQLAAPVDEAPTHPVA